MTGSDSGAGPSDRSNDPAAISAVTSAELIAELLGRCRFPAPGTEVVAAVSGGADSLALLVLACETGLSVTAVHVDHGLRPGSVSEATVVAEAAERFGARFRTERVSIEPGSDLEQRAREARRAVLGPAAMTGHTADDQAETVLINLLRGAGLAGLAAMTAGPLHPILALRRAETVALCRALDLEPVMDPTNEDRRFIRNRVRLELLPLMADISDRDPVPLLNRTSDRARAVQADLVALAEAVDPTDTATLATLAPSVANEALRRWLVDDLGHPPSSAELDRVLAVVRHEVVACELSGGRRVSRRGGVLRVTEG